jgi:hypothetical protein
MVKITKFHTAGWLPGTYEVEIGNYASHPIVEDLGLGSTKPPVVAAAYLDFDFQMEGGKTITGG